MYTYLNIFVRIIFGHIYWNVDNLVSNNNSYLSDWSDQILIAIHEDDLDKF